jgi:uncharacterized protein (DUF58 family)
MFPIPEMSLLTPELLRQLEQFQLLAARRAKSSAKGERRSKARGQSVEFADHRNYVPGDDFRYLDWNLYGRLDRLFLKLYEEERELPVRIFLDASESMTFGEPRKFDCARQVAAAIGYVALCGFDRVSINVFPSGERGTRNAEQTAASPSAIGYRQSAIANSLSRVRGKKSSLQFLQNLARLQAGGTANFNESVRRGALEARQAGLAVVLSDFLDPAGYEAGLTTLIGRGFQVNVVQILAPEELEPTTFGDLRLVDAETGDEREVTFGKFRLKHYQQTVQNFCGRLREYCQTRGMNYFLAASNTDLSDLLLKQLRQAEVLG